MTIVEFYDSTPIENMVSCLAYRPEKIIFIGDKKELERKEPHFYRFLDEVDNFETVISFKGVNRSSLGELIRVLTEISRENEDCCFDLTGGDDLALVAVGVVYERCTDRRPRLLRSNVQMAKAYEVDEHGSTPCGTIPALTVEQNIVLHGGCVVTEEEDKDGTGYWDLDEGFLSELDAMWKICRRDCARWNAQITTLGELRRFNQPCEDPLFFCVKKEEVRGSHIDNRLFSRDPDSLIRSLETQRLIRGVRDEEGYFSFYFKNEQVRRCLTKAGTLLELRTYINAMQVRDSAGAYVFTDGLTGVLLDWDGERHDPGDEKVDTQNEIDVILMRGLVPVFISCKNGNVEEDELYKLNTVAERFGSRYARKALVATTLGKGSISSQRYLRDRADEMGITVIDGVHQMSDEEFRKELARLAY